MTNFKVTWSLPMGLDNTYGDLSGMFYGGLRILMRKVAVASAHNLWQVLWKLTEACVVKLLIHLLVHQVMLPMQAFQLGISGE
ncbi:hypothetical protein ACJX0J_006333, partial [Zea mays]